MHCTCLKSNLINHFYKRLSQLSIKTLPYINPSHILGGLLATLWLYLITKNLCQLKFNPKFNFKVWKALYFNVIKRIELYYCITCKNSSVRPFLLWAALSRKCYLWKIKKKIEQFIWRSKKGHYEWTKKIVQAIEWKKMDAKEKMNLYVSYTNSIKLIGMLEEIEIVLGFLASATIQTSCPSQPSLPTSLFYFCFLLFPIWAHSYFNLILYIFILRLLSQKLIIFKHFYSYYCFCYFLKIKAIL